MQKSIIFFIVAAITLGGFPMGGATVASDSPTEEAVFFVQ